MESSNLPALYHSADTSSNEAQFRYIAVIRLEYFFLVLLAFLGEFRSVGDLILYSMILLIIMLSGLLILRFFSRFDRKWYACRAFAESVKTSAWKFSMRAHPFEDAETIQTPTSNFTKSLMDIQKDNAFTGHELGAKHSDKAQITYEMSSLRNSGWDKRLDVYLNKRIKQQRTWYRKKAHQCSKKRKFWFASAIIIYTLAAFTLLSNLIVPVDFSFAFSGLLVIVTSSFAWIQVKRFGELSVSYTLTAHEIGIIQERSRNVKGEESLSEFVNTAEFAFSREHTQWAARKDAV